MCVSVFIRSLSSVLPPTTLTYTIDIFLTLSLRVGVVVPEYRPLVILRHPELGKGKGEVHVHGLCVTYVKVTIGLGGEPGACYLRNEKKLTVIKR